MGVIQLGSVCSCSCFKGSDLSDLLPKYWDRGCDTKSDMAVPTSKAKEALRLLVWRSHLRWGYQDAFGGV
jgi:hypothetical protein